MKKRTCEISVDGREYVWLVAEELWPARLVGLVGRAMRWHHHLQANTERRREVLSTFFIGRQLVGRHDHDLTPSLFAFALFTLRRLILQALPA